MTCSTTTTIDKNSSDNTELQSLLGQICCVGNVNNIGSIIEQIGPNESLTNWRFYQIGTHQIDRKIKYPKPIGSQKKTWLNLPTG